MLKSSVAGLPEDLYGCTADLYVTSHIHNHGFYRSAAYVVRRRILQ